MAAKEEKTPTRGGARPGAGRPAALQAGATRRSIMLDAATAEKAIQISLGHEAAPKAGSISLGIEMAVAAYKLADSLANR